MSFYIPAFDDVDESGENTCEAGRQDCTATKIEASEAKSSGRDMMVIEWTVDNGKSAGQTIVDRFVFGIPGQFGESKLKRMLLATGLKKWEQRPTIQEFVAQFPENTLRCSVLIERQYNIERDNGWENDVPESVWNTFDGKKNVRANVSDDKYNDYKPAANPPSLDLTASGDGRTGAAPSPAPVDTANLGFEDGQTNPF